MVRHLKSCIKKHVKTPGKKVFHVVVESLESPEYWIHLEIKENISLGVLDNFLRELWLECCGHLSGFWLRIPSVAEEEEIRKSRKIQSVFKPGLKIYYVYDFGTPTPLLIRVISKYENSFHGCIRLIARNYPPLLKCTCGKDAKWICTECMWDNFESALLCEEHADKHECSWEMLLLVLNSPRMGMCAYTGSSLIDIFHLYEYKKCR